MNSINIHHPHHIILVSPLFYSESPSTSWVSYWWDIQLHTDDFKYRTKIRGVTERPRVAYQCDNVESEFKVHISQSCW